MASRIDQEGREPDFRSFRFVQSRAFSAKWQKLKLTDDDLRSLEKCIVNMGDDPSSRTDVGNLRKIRFIPSASNKGKSGGLRVCYAIFIEPGTVFLFTVYGKGEKSDLNRAEKAEVAKVIRELEEQLARGVF